MQMMNEHGTIPNRKEVKNMKVVAPFSERFKELVNGKTCREISDVLGLSKSAVNSYMTGAREPKTPVIRTISQYYGVDPVWLMGYDVPKYKEETPDVSVEGISEDRAQLIQTINQMTDDQVRALRAIADQVLSLRDK